MPDQAPMVNRIHLANLSPKRLERGLLSPLVRGFALTRNRHMTYKLTRLYQEFDWFQASGENFAPSWEVVSTLSQAP